MRGWAVGPTRMLGRAPHAPPLCVTEEDGQPRVPGRTGLRGRHPAHVLQLLQVQPARPRGGGNGPEAAGNPRRSRGRGAGGGVLLGTGGIWGDTGVSGDVLWGGRGTSPAQHFGPDGPGDLVTNRPPCFLGATGLGRGGQRAGRSGWTPREGRPMSSLPQPHRLRVRVSPCAGVRGWSGPEPVGGAAGERCVADSGLCSRARARRPLPREGVWEEPLRGPGGCRCPALRLRAPPAHRDARERACVRAPQCTSPSSRCARVSVPRTCVYSTVDPVGGALVLAAPLFQIMCQRPGCCGSVD